ncbi:MAG: FAD-dependent oxidoreductase [Paracoccaceae bacterium]
MIIVGGGIAGLSLGWQLARRGAPVTLYEAGRIGQGASHVAAGYLQPALPPSPHEALERASLAAFPDFIAAIEADSGLSVDFRRDGQLRVGYAGDEAEMAADTAARRAAGWQVDTLTADDARALEPVLSAEITCASFLRPRSSGSTAASSAPRWPPRSAPWRHDPGENTPVHRHRPPKASASPASRPPPPAPGRRHGALAPGMPSPPSPACRPSAALDPGARRRS